MNYSRLLRESNNEKCWVKIMVWFHFGLVWDGMVPTGSEGRWEKFKPAQRPKMTTHLWAGHVFPAFDFWHLSTAHVLVVFAHFFSFMKLSETKWMRAYRETTLWSRGLQNPACKISILRTKMVLGHLSKINKWTWKECKISKSCMKLSKFCNCAKLETGNCWALWLHSILPRVRGYLDSFCSRKSFGQTIWKL